MGSGTTTHGRGLLVSFRDLADMFGSWDISGLFCLGAPGSPSAAVIHHPRDSDQMPELMQRKLLRFNVPRFGSRPPCRVDLPSQQEIPCGKGVGPQPTLHSVNGVAGWSWGQSCQPLFSTWRCFATRLVAKQQTRIWHNGELEILTGCETDEVFLLVLKGWRGDETTPPKG